MICPKCGYARKDTDAAPTWQCPACGVAVEKYLVAQQAPRGDESQEAARRVALSNPVTAELVTQGQWDVLRPQLPLERRVGMACLDLLMAALFLWCWLRPGAWRPTLASELGTVMVMEFFVLHSSMFLVMGGEAGLGTRITTGFMVMLFYIPIAGAFAWWQGGWWPVLAFVWLLSSRVLIMLAGNAGDAFEAKRGRYYWGNGVGLYILMIFVALLLPIPQLGFSNSSGYVWSGRIVRPPHEIIGWGFLYFAGQAVMKILERPEWVAGTE